MFTNKRLKMSMQLQHTQFTKAMSNDLLSLAICYWSVRENKSISPAGNSKNYIRPRYNHE